MNCSRSEGIRLIKNSGVKINQIQCTDVKFICGDPEYVVHVGKNDSFIVLSNETQIPSDSLILLKWSKFMKTNSELTKDLILSWEFEYGTCTPTTIEVTR